MFAIIKKMSDDLEDEEKKLTRMHIIYKAIEDGWIVKKNTNCPRTYEFTKPCISNIVSKNLIIFSRSNILEDIESHINNISLDKKVKVKKIKSVP